MQIKPKKCRNCGEKFTPNKSTQVACSYPCALNLGRKKVSEDKFKELKEKATDWGKKLQLKVQEIARLIDYGQPCIARGIRGQMHGGHVFSKGAHGNMKYNLHNIFSQSAQSNHFQSDDRLMHDGVKNTFGYDYYNFIIELNQTPITKHTNEDYHTYYVRSCEFANYLKKDLKICTTEQRIRLRNFANMYIKIYDIGFCFYKL